MDHGIVPFCPAEPPDIFVASEGQFQKHAFVSVRWLTLFPAGNKKSAALAKSGFRC
jgi:hypothetical protein